MSLRFALDQLNPAMREQAQKKLDELRAVSTARTVILAGSDVKQQVKAKPAKRRPPLIPKLSAPEERLAFHLRAEGLGHFVREYKFWPQRKFRFDFAFVDERIAVEVDGGLHTQGRHTRADGYERDQAKRNEATIMGWRVLNFSPSMVSSGHAVHTIKRALEARLQGGENGAGDAREEEAGSGHRAGHPRSEGAEGAAQARSAGKVAAHG